MTNDTIDNDNIVDCKLELPSDKLERFYNGMITETEKWSSKSDVEIEEGFKEAMGEINNSKVKSYILALKLIRQIVKNNYEELKTKDQVTTDNYLFQI